MIVDAPLRERLSASALEYVARFDWDKSTDSFLEMLTRLLGINAAQPQTGRTA